MSAPRLRILLVEDDPASAGLVIELLERSGLAQVTHVDRIRAALERLEAESFEVVLLDLQLPDGWGLDLLAQLRERAPEMPVVVLTGNDDEHLALEAVQQGAQDYLTKSQVDHAATLLPRALRYAIERQRSVFEHRRAAAALRQAYGEIEGKVAERTVELSQANARLEVEIGERERAEGEARRANLELTRQVEELRERERQLRLLNEMGELLQSCLTPREAYQVIAQAARAIFSDPAMPAGLRMSSGALCIIAPYGRAVEVVAAWGELEPAPEGEGDCGEAAFVPHECWGLRRGQIHITDPVERSLACGHLRLPSARSLCVPMMAQGEALGVLYLADSSAAFRSGALLHTVAPLASAFAEHISLSLANLRLRERLQRQAIRDPLTGLFNRRYMEETLERELRRAERGRGSVGLIMIDVDHFKAVNDRFGHGAGDAMLANLGAFLETHTRGSDIVCRYGGEEFVLILPEAEVEQVAERAEQVRREAAGFTAEHEGRQIGPLTLSLGIAMFPRDGGGPGALLRAADQALYGAKQAGRNQIVVAPGAAA